MHLSTEGKMWRHRGSTCIKWESLGFGAEEEGEGVLLQSLAPSGTARQEDMVWWWSRTGYAMGAASASLPAVSCL